MAVVEGEVLGVPRAIGGSFTLPNSVHGEGKKSRRSSERYSWWGGVFCKVLILLTALM
jgi:hypothetical protein